MPEVIVWVPVALVAAVLAGGGLGWLLGVLR